MVKYEIRNINMRQKIFATGGTFDKIYDPISEKLVFKETHIPEILRLGKNKNEIGLETLMLKDSLYMTDSDRNYILKKCQDSLEDRILIVHGTGTMIETAKMLGENLDGKTVVLTGAMVPYSFKYSDAMFNLAYAYGAIQTLHHGIYISMNGKIFYWNNARKNTETGEFETIK